MDPSVPLRQTRITILGLGLMGGSLALALRGHCARLMGVDPDPATRRLAIENQVVDQAASEVLPFLPWTDLVVLASPVSAILSTLEQLPGWLSSGVGHAGEWVVLDLGSTKVDIVNAMQILPAGFDPMGGHPMCGKEKGTLANADPGLFKGAAFALVPLERTSTGARDLALELVETIGAHPLWLDAKTHDAWTAATSHLPYLLAAVLAGATPPGVAPLIGPGWRSSARLAGSSLPMMLDILRSNREQILPALRHYSTQLAQVEKWLADEDWESLGDRLEVNRSAYHQILAGLEEM